MNLAYAESMSSDGIFILSAKYGLLELEQIIPPYEMTLNNMSVSQKRAWAHRVLDSLQKKAKLKSDLFIFLAGLNYRKYLLPELVHYEIPFEGLPFGRQLQELKRRIAG